MSTSVSWQLGLDKQSKSIGGDTSYGTYCRLERLADVQRVEIGGGCGDLSKLNYGNFQV